MMAKADIDQRFMAAALRLARRGLGRTWPNPSVGALVVDRNNLVVGRGWTADGGRPHAEPIALEEAGEAARGATLYVTLEPCAHHGKTPPCAEKIIQSGISRVVCAIGDPDTRVAGQGIKLLKEAGINVTLGVGEGEARLIGQGHVMRVTQNRPFVRLKLAISKDGRVARPYNQQTAITGAQANRWVHRMRAQSDAIMIGVGTALADNPSLTCRLPGAEQLSPVRIVVDADLRLGTGGQLAQSASEIWTWVLASRHTCDERLHALQAQNVRILRCNTETGEKIDLSRGLELLSQEGITRLMVEGGANLAKSLVMNRLVDEVVLIEGQIEIGDDGLLAFADIGPELVTTSTDYSLCEEVSLGDDTARTYRYRR